MRANWRNETGIKIWKSLNWRIFLAMIIVQFKQSKVLHIFLIHLSCVLKYVLDKFVVHGHNTEIINICPKAWLFVVFIVSFAKMAKVVIWVVANSQGQHECSLINAITLLSFPVCPIKCGSSMVNITYVSYLRYFLLDNTIFRVTFTIKIYLILQLFLLLLSPLSSSFLE